MTLGEGGLDVVTGAFSYSGAAITSELQAAGRLVRTLTGHPGRATADTGIEVRPLDFADPAALAESLRDARTLYNTYWVRFAHPAHRRRIRRDGGRPGRHRRPRHRRDRAEPVDH